MTVQFFTQPFARPGYKSRRSTVRLHRTGSATFTNKLSAGFAPGIDYVLVGWDPDTKTLVLKPLTQWTIGASKIIRRAANADMICAGTAFRHFGILPTDKSVVYEAEWVNGEIHARQVQESLSLTPIAEGLNP